MNDPSKEAADASGETAGPGCSTAGSRLVGLLGGTMPALSAPQIEAAYQRARQMSAANLLEPAQAVLEALLLLQPDATRFVRALGIVYLRRQEPKKARAMFAYGLRRDPTDAVMQLLRGECMLLCGDKAAGIEALKQALAATVPTPQNHTYVLRARKCLTMARGGAR